MSGTAVAGYILAILMPFIGFLIGLALIARGDRHGAGVTVLSVVVFLVFVALISS